MRRASGRTLGLSRSTLLTAVRVAACDRRVNDGSWRNLDYSRRALLLPLKDPPLLRAAAKHVVDVRDPSWRGLTWDEVRAEIERSLRVPRDG